VTELKYLYPEAVDKDRRYAALFFFALGIAYNKDKFKQAGIAEPTSWKDLWDPKLSGHISIPDIVNIQGRDFIIQTARLNGGGEDTPDKGIDQIAKIKAHSYYTGSNTVQAQLESGDVWVTVWNNMRAGAMAERGLPIRFVMPKEGTIGNTDTIAMVATTKYPREAQTLAEPVRAARHGQGAAGWAHQHAAEGHHRGRSGMGEEGAGVAGGAPRAVSAELGGVQPQSQEGHRLLEPGDPQVASAEALSRPATAAAHMT
jgi:spermidine/putrescine-binding protein